MQPLRRAMRNAQYVNAAYNLQQPAGESPAWMALPLSPSADPSREQQLPAGPFMAHQTCLFMQEVVPAQHRSTQAAPERHVCMQGLVKWNAASQQVTLLTSRVSSTSPLAPSTLINYANDLTIAADGTIYFTDSSAIHVKRHEQGYWDTYNSYFLTMLQVQREA